MPYTCPDSSPAVRRDAMDEIGYKSQSPSPSAPRPTRRHAAAQLHAASTTGQESSAEGEKEPRAGVGRTPEQRGSPPLLPHLRDELHGTAPRTFCTAPTLHCDASHQPRHHRYVYDSHLCAPPSRALAPWPHAANALKALPLHSPRPPRVRRTPARRTLAPRHGNKPRPRRNTSDPRAEEPHRPAMGAPCRTLATTRNRLGSIQGTTLSAHCTRRGASPPVRAVGRAARTRAGTLTATGATGTNAPGTRDVTAATRQQ